MTEQTPATPPADPREIVHRHAADYFAPAAPDDLVPDSRVQDIAVNFAIDLLRSLGAGAVPDTGHQARKMLGEILAVVNRHQGCGASADRAMQEIEDVISTSLDALAIREGRDA